jgi:hypothetical protein
MGWEPRTVFEQDDAGRVVASTREVEWDEEQRDLMMALDVYRAGLCPLCGWPAKTCQDPANANLLEPQVPARCYVRTNIEVKQEKEASESHNRPQPSALLWGARMKDAI